MLLKRLFVVLALTLLTQQVFAESSTDTLTLSHPNISSPLTFNIHLPHRYSANKSKRYVLMFNLHPQSNTYLTGMHDWMSHNGEWPWLETIIVTPQSGNLMASLFDPSGATTPMLDFMEATLLPAIDNKYRTNGYRIISGFRVDGSVVLSSLLNKPTLFNAHIAVSPELSNDMAGILSSAKPKLISLDNKPRYLLFSHGTSVKESHQYGHYQTLEQQLKAHAPSSLQWQYLPLEDSYFMSLPLLSVIKGIEQIFDDIHTGLSAESTVSQGGVDSIVSHYHYLSNEKYGFEVSPKFSIKTLADSKLSNSLEEGLQIYQVLVQLYPDDPYSYHNIAKAYAKYGDFQQAVVYQERAVNKAKPLSTWHQKRHQRFLDTYRLKQQ